MSESRNDMPYEGPICDPHIHLFPGQRSDGSFEGGYGAEDLLADLATEPRVESTVFIEAHRSHRTEGPEVLRPVGETEWLVEEAEPPAATGIVGFADLRFGAAVEDLLAADIAVAKDRFRGIRYPSAWDPSPDIPRSFTNPEPGILKSDSFLAAMRVLAEFGLSFDAFLYFTQLADIAWCADHVPDLPIVIDHLGAPLGTGPYANQKDDVWRALLDQLRELAKRDNVFLKLSGTGIPRFGWRREGVRVSAQDVADEWGPLVRACIDILGPSRCMFASNYPPDRGMVRYPDVWEAYRIMTAEYSRDDCAALFHGTATKFYQLPG